MYWTHLSFALLLSFTVYWECIAGSQPGFLDFDNLPETNFSCEGKVIGGYYADIETGCQMFHVCTIGQKGEITDIKFLCLNGTVFDQETRVCERIDEVDCSKSESFFGLNLELYGNNAQLGIQPENEFDCEDCSSDEVTESDYSDEYDVTTFKSTTTTTTTTTTPPTTTTAPTTTTTPKPTTRTPEVIHYPSSSPETIAALLALHNAFTQSLGQHSNVKPAPPHVINNAFSSPLKSSQSHTPYRVTIPSYSSTPRTNINVSLKTHFSTNSHIPASGKQNSYQTTGESQTFQSLPRPKPTEYVHGYPRHHFPITTPKYDSPLKSNYHHFQSGDASFAHSFDSENPFNYQYFRSSTPSSYSVFNVDSDKPSISIVTSTSTSTSVKTSKDKELNVTADDFPTGYDDYQEGDVGDDPFFRDVPKLSSRPKRSPHSNHKYPDEEVRHPNHKYDSDNSTDIPPNHKYDEEKNNIDDKVKFLGNLLGSIDMARAEREKLMTFFVKSEPEMGKEMKSLEIDNFLEKLEDKIESVNLQLNETTTEMDPLADFYDSSNFTYDIAQINRELGGNISLEGTRQKRETDDIEQGIRKFDEDTSGIEFTEVPTRPLAEEKSPSKRNSDGGEVKFEPRKRVRGQSRRERVRAEGRAKAEEIKPVTELVDEGDFTTAEYTRAPIRRGRLRPKQETVNSENSRPQTRFNYTKDTKEHRTLIKLSTSTTEIPLAHTIQTMTRDPNQLKAKPVYEVQEQVPLSSNSEAKSIAQEQVPKPNSRRRGPSRGGTRHSSNRPSSSNSTESPTTTTSTSPNPFIGLSEDPNFSCDGKVKGGFYADISNDCKGFFICSQGAINGPLLKTHFWCGATTKFNQRSRTCQAEANVECSISARYYHLNNDFLVPELEEELKTHFEPMKV